MPLHEYRCEKCRKLSEIFQNFSEKPVKICPHCGGRLKKLISAPAIQFKGSGWYVSDYAAKSGSKDSADKAESVAKPEKAEKTDKPEKTADSKKEGKPGTKAKGEKKE